MSVSAIFCVTMPHYCCGTTFWQVEKLVFHLEYVHKISSYACPITKCYRTFHTRSVLKKHLITNHDFSNASQNLKPFKKIENNLETPADTNFTNNNFPKDGNSCKSQSYINKGEFLKKIEESLNQSVIDFVTKLYSNLSMSRSTIQFVITCVRSFILAGGLQEILDAIENYGYIEDTIVDIKFVKDALNIFQHSFDNYNTEYKRTTFFQRSEKYVQPKQYKIGITNGVSRRNCSTSLVLKPLTCAYISLSQNLKLFLELPNVLTKILTYQEKLSNTKSDIMCNVIQGNLWINLKEHFIEPYTLPLLVYFDDLQIGNPLGSHATFTKVGAVYYSIPTIPPEYSSKLQNIFVAEIFHSTHRSNCSNESTFRILLDELKLLETCGIVVNTSQGLQRIAFCVILIIGDNLGLHTVLGLSESFNAINYCRFCIGNKSELIHQTKEENNLMRQKCDYDEHVQNGLYGVKERCIWNSLKYFHIYQNYNCDIMHDLFEGVHRYELPRILKGLIDNNCFSLQTLNIKIKYSAYEYQARNIVPCIKQEHLNKGFITCSASEMFHLIHNMRFIIGDLVPAENPYWQFYLLLLEITDILIAPEISSDTISHLDRLIEEHNRTYITLFGENLKPKHHFMVHYPRIIKLVGPLSLLSSLRFEAKHRELKSIANSTRSRLNIPITIANRLQLQSCYRYFSRLGLEDHVNIGPLVELNTATIMNNEVLSSYYSIGWYERNGMVYKSSNVLYYADENSVPQFAKIKEIFLHKESLTDVIFYCDPYTTEMFNAHYKAYLVNIKNSPILISYNSMRCVYPTIEHVQSSGIYISLPKNLHMW